MDNTNLSAFVETHRCKDKNTPSFKKYMYLLSNSPNMVNFSVSYELFDEYIYSLINLIRNNIKSKYLF